MKTSGNTILVTGGGSGIGEALAQRWHDAGNKVIVAGRNEAKLASAVAGRANMVAMPLDIDNPAAIAAFAGRIVAEHPDLNILVNNAGIMPLEQIGARRSLTEAEATITTNLLGPIRLTDALVDHLVGTPDSAIINVTSGLAFVPLPRASTYSATKAALHSYTVSLRVALAGRVEVIEIAPPGVQTELTLGTDRTQFMPLDEFADETMALLATHPTPEEILVERVKPLRLAEQNGAYAMVLGMLSHI